jgi:hypothetical protein
LQKSFNVIPAKAGIQVFQGHLDRGRHRGDGFVEFCKRLGIDMIRNWSRSEKNQSRFPLPKDLRWISTG